ncbi:MAG: hypothetical protein PV362_09605 [Providencia heimbachae]|nr:hypothetical protein [Providencia heimbachae]
MKTERETFNQLKPVLSKIGILATEGEGILNEPSKTTTTLTMSTSTKGEKISEPMSAGSAQNLGDNSGTIRGGDSVSNSLIVNGATIDGSEALAVSVDCLAENINGLAQSIECAVSNASSDLKESSLVVRNFAQTSLHNVI